MVSIFALHVHDCNQQFQIVFTPFSRSFNQGINCIKFTIMMPFLSSLSFSSLAAGCPHPTTN